MSSINFSKAVKAERLRLELTQTQLAELVGTTQQNVAGWERGKSLPKHPTWEKLCEVFGKHSIINNLPPKGEIPGGTEILLANQVIDRAQTNAIHALPAPSPCAMMPADPHVVMLSELFSKLPDDPMVRAMALGECAKCIQGAISASSQQESH